MHRHPELGFSDEGHDLTAAQLYARARAPFGEASVLPPAAFRSKVFANLEDEKVWTRLWTAAGSATQIPSAGDMLPYTVGNHGIHVQRLEGGGFIGRFNKAQHGGCRFVPLQCQTGIKTKCSYTSCGYSRDRDVIRADELGEGLPALRHYVGDQPERLLPVRVEGWGPLLFVNVDQTAPDLAAQLGTLPEDLAAFFAAPWRDVAGSWSEHRCNWKLAGSRLLEHLEIPGAAGSSPRRHADEIRSEGEGHTRVEIPLPHPCSPALAPFGGIDPAAGATLCWVYPNLLLALLPDHIVSIVLQPTSFYTCLTRLRLFVSAQAQPSPATDAVVAALHEGWRGAIAAACRAAAQRQELLEKWGTPSLPDTSEDDLPVEDSAHGYHFQRFLIDRILAEHSYVWNAPLFTPSVR